MTGEARSVRPAPMEGGGVYNRSSRVQAAGLLPAVVLFGQAAGQVALVSRPAPLVIADYCCSEGHTSLLPVAVALGALLGKEAGIQTARCSRLTLRHTFAVEF